MLKVHVQKRAEQDIVNIWHYTFENWGEKQADKYHDQLAEAFGTIAEFPEIGKKCDYVRKGYRKHYIGKHIIFYRVGKAKVHVIRVLGDSMDYKQQL